MMNAAPIQRRKPALRAFSGLVGQPYEPEKPVAILAPGPVLVPALTPAKKAGRPRVYQYSSEAERKRVARAATQLQLEKLLNQFDLSLDSPIADEIKKKYAIDAETYGELLKLEGVRDKVLNKVLHDIAAETRLIHGAPNDGLNSNPDSPYMFLRGAPKGCGKLVTGGCDSEKISELTGIREQGLEALSGPGGHDLITVDRRRTKVADNPDDHDTEDVRTDADGTELTFTIKMRWPKGWFQEKYKRPYPEVADECALQVSRLLSKEVEDRAGYSEEQGHEAGVVYFCSLCNERQGPWVTSGHFLKRHLSAVKVLFKTAGVAFRKKYFGKTISDIA